jgi:hypothetical protein
MKIKRALSDSEKKDNEKQYKGDDSQVVNGFIDVQHHPPSFYPLIYNLKR